MNVFFRYIRRYWVMFITAILFLTAEALCDLMQPTIMAKIIDIGVKQKDSQYVMEKGLTMLLIAALGAVFACTRAVIASHVSQRIGMELRGDLFKKIQHFSFKSRDTFEEASLITRLTNDVTQVQNFINGMMRIFVKAPILCIGSVIMAVMLNAKLAVILLVVIPAIVCLIRINLKAGYPYFVKIQKALDGVNTVVREYLAGVRLVKAFNRFEHEKERFRKENNYLGDVSRSAAKMVAVFSPLVQFTVNLGIVVIIWFSGVGVSRGAIEVGEVMAFINYMTQILFSLSMITHVFMSYIRAKASAERIQEIFEEKSEKDLRWPVAARSRECLISEPQEAVSFHNVSFSYSDSLEKAVLKEISFTCKRGEMIGIIGSTGSGKSSLVNLVPGFYIPQTGMIKVNGIDVKTTDIHQLREKIAVVSQKTMLFTGTIEENIKWGKENAAMEEIKEAATISQADGFISQFPEGYQTLLGQGGINLSGGQKQRIAIARALIKNPEILILDDCTSAVDLVTEAQIRQGLKDYLKDVSTLIIAQRISSVKNADRIIVLEDGEIAGMGSHDELVKNCEVYKAICLSQLGKEAV